MIALIICVFGLVPNNELLNKGVYTYGESPGYNIAIVFVI